MNRRLSAARAGGEMMRCRPGTVRNSWHCAVPDQRCTTRARLVSEYPAGSWRALALHRIRDTRTILAPMREGGQKPIGALAQDERWWVSQRVQTCGNCINFSALLNPSYAA